PLGGPYRQQFVCSHLVDAISQSSVSKSCFTPVSEIRMQQFGMIPLTGAPCPTIVLFRKAGPPISQCVQHVTVHIQELIAVLWPGALIFFRQPLQGKTAWVHRAGFPSAKSSGKTSSSTTPGLVPDKVGFLPDVLFHPGYNFWLDRCVGLPVLGVFSKSV